MFSQISSVIKQAFMTFGSKPEAFYSNLEQLKGALNKTTAADVNFSEHFMDENFWKEPHRAPATYIDIYDDVNFTVGIFVLKPGMKLPLHNHPEMYGLIKVIAGQIKITSYSINTEKTLALEARNENPLPVYLRPFITAELLHRDIIIGSEDECCFLKPDVGNLHEIESVEGPAAFIDILAPPYESIIPNIGIRKCHYYRVIQEVIPNIFKMQEIGTPPTFWTESFPYSGPSLS